MRAARDLVDEWAAVALERPRLFTDDPSARPNPPGFHEHRHDQAIFSALMYNRGWAGSTDGWSCLQATRLRAESLRAWGESEGLQLAYP